MRTVFVVGRIGGTVGHWWRLAKLKGISKTERFQFHFPQFPVVCSTLYKIGIPGSSLIMSVSSCYLLDLLLLLFSKGVDPAENLRVSLSFVSSFYFLSLIIFHSFIIILCCSVYHLAFCIFAVS